MGVRVLMTEAGGLWYAQGLEADYGASGGSREDVERRFREGLVATLRDATEGDESALDPAPEDEWRRWERLEADPERRIERVAYTGEEAALLPAGGWSFGVTKPDRVAGP